jgi:hypothetical protein
MLDTFEHNGTEYVIELEADDYTPPPWEHECGHVGVEQRHVSYGGTIRKAPGERILYREGFAACVYDHAESVRIARHEGWAASREDAEACRRGEITEGQRAERAVVADADRMRRWVSDDWSYVVVIVRRADACRCCGKSAEIGGVESDCIDFINEVARELAEELEG